jgi:hypothetical protein
MAEATLRLPAEMPDHEPAVMEAMIALFQIYGPGFFDISVTANVVLQGNRDRRYGVFYGQDFGADRRGNLYRMTAAQTVTDPSEVYDLRTHWTQDDFEDVFYGNFGDTDVSIHSVINYIYLIRRHLGNFDAQTAVGTQYQTLY